MPQAEALLRHGLFVLLGPGDRLCGPGLRRSGHLLRPAADLLHGFGLVLRRPGCRVLLGSRCLVLRDSGRNLLRSAGDLLHPGSHLLLGSRRQLLRSLGLVLARS